MACTLCGNRNVKHPSPRVTSTAAPAVPSTPAAAPGAGQVGSPAVILVPDTPAAAPDAAHASSPAAPLAPAAPAISPIPATGGIRPPPFNPQGWRVRMEDAVRRCREDKARENAAALALPLPGDNWRHIVVSMLVRETRELLDEVEARVPRDGGEEQERDWRNAVSVIYGRLADQQGEWRVQQAFAIIEVQNDLPGEYLEQISEDGEWPTTAALEHVMTVMQEELGWERRYEGFGWKVNGGAGGVAGAPEGHIAETVPAMPGEPGNGAGESEDEAENPVGETGDEAENPAGEAGYLSEEDGVALAADFASGDPPGWIDAPPREAPSGVVLTWDNGQSQPECERGPGKELKSVT